MKEKTKITTQSWIPTLFLFSLINIHLTTSVQLNGWYPCNQFTYSDGDEGDESGSEKSDANGFIIPRGFLKRQKHLKFNSLFSDIFIDRSMSPEIAKKKGKAKVLSAECAQLSMPFCHPDVCKQKTNSSESTIPIFVRRLLGKRLNKNPILWVLQGGPGASSIALETFMVMMSQLLDGKVDIYTMDHRGVGRSRRLSCEATQVDTSGSPNGTTVTEEELVNCVKDFAFQTGNTPEAFSVTSAATDLKMLIDELNVQSSNKNDIFVYGVSYGTYLVQRYLQLAPDQPTGVILDGIVSQEGGNRERMTFTRWDEDMDLIGIEFLHRCQQSKECSKKLGGNPIKWIINLYEKLNNGHCSNLFSKSASSTADDLKTIFGRLLQMQSLRSLIPVFAYRVDRCEEKDIKVIHRFLEVFEAMGDDDGNVLDSDLLYSVIVSSEMWTIPTPNFDSLTKIFKKSLISSGVQDLLAVYCIFSGDPTETCRKINPSSRSSMKSYTYRTDQYFNKTADLSGKKVSTLLLSGMLDPQTPNRYAEIQYRHMNGKKKLIRFNNSAHGTIMNTPFPGSTHSCAATIIASYIKEEGDLTKIDESCVAKVTPLSFDISPVVSNLLLGTSDPYDGEPASQSKSSTIARTTFVACVVALGILLLFCIVGVIVLVRRLRKKK